MQKKLIQPANSNFKVVENCFEMIKDFEAGQKVFIDDPGQPAHQILADLNKEEIYQLKIEGLNKYYGITNVRPIGLKLKKHELQVTKLSWGHGTLGDVTFNIKSFQSVGYQAYYPFFYRLVIPNNQKISIQDFFENIPYQTKGVLSSECIRISFKGASFDLYLCSAKKSKKPYLVIESSSKFTRKDFDQYCYSILVSFAFITGKYIADEGYFFAYEASELDQPAHVFYSVLRGSISTNYFPINRNASFFAVSRRENITFRKQMRTLTKPEFSHLCQWAHRSVDFSSILLLIVESMTASLLIMPAGLSVALEGLVDLICEGKTDSIAPMKKSVSKKVRTDISKVIEKYSSEISKEGLEILKKRVENINQVTNRNRLRLPFKLLNHHLSPEDERALDHRNDFLHGNTSLGLSDDISSATNEVLYISLRLYTLLSIAILKSIGFDNLIWNYPKLYEDFYKKKLDESYFRQL